MKHPLSPATRQSVIRCPVCGWTLMIQPDPALHIVSYPKEGSKRLGRLKCPRCRKQIFLYYN